MRRFKDRRALVTGAGDGIGKTLAQALSRDGARVAVLDIRCDAAVEVAKELPRALAITADVADPSSLAAAAEEVEKSWGRLDILWINAGVGSASRVADAEADEVRWVFGVNILGPVWTAQAFLPLLRRGQRPAIGVTASTAALASPERFSLYAVSKHAALAAGEALRNDLAPEGIGVTLFCPGLLATGIWNSRRARPERFGGPRDRDPDGAARWMKAQPPDRAVDHALSVMARGGGYAVHETDFAGAIPFETRVGAVRRAFNDHSGGGL